MKILYRVFLSLILYSSNKVITNTTTNTNLQTNVSYDVSAKTDANWKRLSEESKGTYKNSTDGVIYDPYTTSVLNTVQSEKDDQSGIGVTKSYLDLMLMGTNDTIHTNTFFVLKNFIGTGMNETRRVNSEKVMENMKNKAQQDKTVPEREEGIGDPYWPQGDWVFLRTASPTTTLSTAKTVQGRTTTTMNPMEIHRACDRTCDHYYKMYGIVCGHRYNTKTWRNEYRNFTNICDLEHANCNETDKRPSWHLLHRGECQELKTFNLTLVGDIKPKDILERKKQWDPYTYIPIYQTRRSTEP